ncbi:MAG TPA: ribonuclease H-like domain-containing protein [Vicinamibacterales bacterium]|nr:ribonuclease H-like domain-containing protein [Vicinamibacterales bacterium]
MTMDPGKLRDRLRGIVRPLGSGAASALPPPLDAPRAAGADGADRPKPGARARDANGALERVLGGEWRTRGDHARSFVVGRRFEPDILYGRARVGDLAASLDRSQRGAHLLCGGPAGVPFVFFDLETTGLSGGAGTHAFLVGCAWFEASGAFVVEQHLMTDYGGERSMLNHVAVDLAKAGALVTFNGKSFDAPVIDTRYLFHRLAPPCVHLPHLDVLHPARRFWGGEPALGCSLIALEQQLLGAQRIGDVPGFEIPARYFQFVRTGDAQPLADVFEHNRLDLLSLAALTARLLLLVSEGADAAADEREALALGKVYERAGDAVRAGQAFERAVVLATGAIERGARRRAAAEWSWTPHGIRVEALRALALGARRSRRYADAAVRWRQLLDLPGCPLPIRREATEALAIHHEHRERDLAAARLFALKSLEAGTEAAWGDAVRHRLARLDRKMGVSERSLFPSSS